MSVIVLDGIRQMYYEEQDVFYYITLMNENYEMPILPLGSTEGICKGIYRLSERAVGAEAAARAALRQRGDPPRGAAGAGPAGAEVRRRQHVYSVTSYKNLYYDGRDCDRWNRLHPRRDAAAAVRGAGARRRQRARSWRPRTTSPPCRQRSAPGSVPDYTVLGTDGFGRSEAREDLRRFFEVDAENIALAALEQLVRKGQFPKKSLPRRSPCWDWTRKSRTRRRCDGPRGVQ